MPVRKGRALSGGIYGISDILHDPSYATTLGLVLWQVRGKEGTVFQVKTGGILGRFMGFVKKLFRA
jgi:hypothetical protein